MKRVARRSSCSFDKARFPSIYAPQAMALEVVARASLATKKGNEALRAANEARAAEPLRCFPLVCTCWCLHCLGIRVLILPINLLAWTA